MDKRSWCFTNVFHISCLIYNVINHPLLNLRLFSKSCHRSWVIPILKEHLFSYRMELFQETFNVNETCLFIADCLEKNEQINNMENC